MSCAAVRPNLQNCQCPTACVGSNGTIQFWIYARRSTMSIKAFGTAHTQTRTEVKANKCISVEPKGHEKAAQHVTTNAYTSLCHKMLCSWGTSACPHGLDNGGWILCTSGPESAILQCNTIQDSAAKHSEVLSANTGARHLLLYSTVRCGAVLYTYRAL